MAEKYTLAPSQSSVDRADRLATLRNMAGLSITDLSKKYNIGYTTLREWEKGIRPLSPKGAKLIVEAMKQEGIDCTLAWLLHGSGEVPTYINKKSNIPFFSTSMLEHEIALFRGSYLNAIILTIQDDAMRPFVSAGDQVGGICTEKIELFENEYCIIESKVYGSFCRWVQKIPHDHLFICQAINLPTDSENPIILKPDEVIKAAPVLRVWKKERSQKF
jgi:transcriptional regulator with XRE-family HTH domain